MTIRHLYPRLKNYVAPYWLVFSLLLLVLVLMAITDTVLPVLIKPMLDSTIIDKNQEFMQLITLIIIALFVVRGIASYIDDYVINWTNNKLIEDLRTAMFDKLLTLSPRFFVGQTSESLISKLTFEIAQFTRDATKVVTILVKDTLTIIGLLVWMIYLNWELSLLALMIAIVVVLSVQLISEKSQENDWETHQAMEIITQVIQESTENHKIVALDGGQQYESDRFQNEANQLRHFNMKIINANAFKMPLLQIVVAIVLTTIFYLAIQQTATDKTTVGSYASLIVSMLILVVSLKRLTSANKFLQRSLATAESIFSVLDLEAESDTGTIIIGRARGKLQFEHVSFYYNPKEYAVLNDITFTIRPGETVALVGSSDDSKNVFVNLVPRFFQPTNGKILLDGHELTTLKLGDLRSNIGLVPQEVILFNDSIAANIAFGEMRCATEVEIIAAAQAAHAIEFIREMPQGMQTRVGKRGVKLSRGQRQRIAIARVILKNPPILILDEPTSTLDSESEHYIQTALETLIQNRTTIIIARRGVTIEKADRIFVLEQNHISEIGNHRELLSKGGIYAKLYQSQI
ncbi:MAG: lipid A export permease/ATP-binding protein MsbA [Nitrosomonadaceae bacterium]|nr:lipid A export permease/ATP-binding protein MsbA [Nitrosomonadaceae bacterium]